MVMGMVATSAIANSNNGESDARMTSAIGMIAKETGIPAWTALRAVYTEVQLSQTGENHYERRQVADSSGYRVLDCSFATRFSGNYNLSLVRRRQMQIDYSGANMPNTGARGKLKSDGICPRCHKRYLGELSLRDFQQRCPAGCGYRWRVDFHGRPRTMVSA